MTVLRRSDNPILRICLEVSLILEAKDVLEFTNTLAILRGPFPDNGDVGSRDEAIHVDRNVILGSSIWCVRRREKEHRVEPRQRVEEAEKTQLAALEEAVAEQEPQKSTTKGTDQKDKAQF